MVGPLGGSFGGHSLCSVWAFPACLGDCGGGGLGQGQAPRGKGVRGSSVLISLSNPASCSRTQARKTGCVSRAPSPAYIHLCSRRRDPDTGQGEVERGLRPEPGSPSCAGTALGGLPAPTPGQASSRSSLALPLRQD